MSQDYGYDPGFDPDPRPRSSSGCRRGCMIAGIIVLVLLVLAVIAVVYVIQHISSGMTADPQEVRARLTERYPTAKVPAGYAGRLGMRFKLFVEMDLLIFAQDDAQVGEEGKVIEGNALVLVALAFPGAKENELEKAVEGVNREGRVVERKRHTVRAGEYEFEGFWQLVEHREDGAKVTQPQIIVPLGNGTMVIMQGDDDQVDEAALKVFLESIAKDVPGAKKVKNEAAPKQADEEPQ